jgi:SAM-dependent methyltransferase
MSVGGTDPHVLRATFDESPELYDRSRLTAPSQVFDDLVALAGLVPGSRIVEIGCGTGQATLPLAERGLEIVGVEVVGVERRAAQVRVVADGRVDRSARIHRQLLGARPDRLEGQEGHTRSLAAADSAQAIAHLPHPGSRSCPTPRNTARRCHGRTWRSSAGSTAGP